MSETIQPLALEAGKTYVVKVFIGDSEYDIIHQNLQDASRVSGSNIVILPVEDIRNVQFIEKVTVTNE